MAVCIIPAAAFLFFMAKDLQWFKFSPLNWMTGRIKKETPEIQVAFLELVCQYWKNGCKMTIEQAELEVERNFLNRLIERKLIKVSCDMIRIQFLDEQNVSIDAISEQRRLAVKARWDAKAKQKDSNVIQTNTNVLQNDTDKTREDKTREDKIILPFGDGFRSAWDKWLKYRKEIKKPYKSKLSQEAALRHLSKGTEQQAIDMIEKSIANQWQGVVFDRIPEKPKEEEVDPRKKHKYSQAEVDKALMWPHIWEKEYEGKLKYDNEFRKHFGYAELPSSKGMGGNGKDR